MNHTERPSKDECVQKKGKNTMERRTSSSHFPTKLFHLLEKCEQDKETSIVWMPGGEAFQVVHKKRFSEQVMPLFFRSGVYKSFQRNLNLYDFKTIMKEDGQAIYQHPMFCRNRPELYSRMTRPRPGQTQSEMSSPPLRQQRPLHTPATISTPPVALSNAASTCNQVNGIHLPAASSFAPPPPSDAIPPPSQLQQLLLLLASQQQEQQDASRILQELEAVARLQQLQVSLAQQQQQPMVPTLAASASSLLTQAALALHHAVTAAPPLTLPVWQQASQPWNHGNGGGPPFMLPPSAVTVSVRGTAAGNVSSMESSSNGSQPGRPFKKRRFSHQNTKHAIIAPKVERSAFSHNNDPNSDNKEDQEKNPPDNISNSLILPCRARGMPLDHNSHTAFFRLETSTGDATTTTTMTLQQQHGMGLICSHPVCRQGGVKFRYCAFCRGPASKWSFTHFHSHNPATKNASTTSRGDVSNQEEGGETMKDTAAVILTDTPDEDTGIAV